MRKRLHFDCFSGISGDMTVAALLEIGVPREFISDTIGSLGIEASLRVETVKRAGVAATKVFFDAPDQHAHRHLRHVEEIIARGCLADGARQLALRMFRRLAEAEAAVHGIAIEKVHFHEVGAVDSICDFVAIAAAIDWLKPDHISSSPIPTGSGFVQCDHGLMPIPAPATARLLVNVPLARSDAEGEMTTPTGAAVVATVVNEFAGHPAMTIERLGHGAGGRDVPKRPNVLRVFWGTDAAEIAADDQEADSVWKLETNLDDVTAEVVGYSTEQILAAGALDVFVQPVQMKKGRPGVVITALCRDSDRARVEAAIFAETGTLGIRRQLVERTIQKRRAIVIETPWGRVSGKVASRNGRESFSPEFEDCARIARERGVALRTVETEIQAMFTPAVSKQIGDGPGTAP